MTKSAARNLRCSEPWDTPGLPCLSELTKFWRAAPSTGARPKTTPLMIETTNVNNNTRPSMAISSRRGNARWPQKPRLRREHAQCSHSHDRNQNTCQPSGHCQHHAFRKELLHQAAGPGTDAAPDCNLSLPRGRARERKVSNIEESDQQNQHHRPAQNKQQRADISNDQVAQRHDGIAQMLETLGIRTLNFAGQSGEFLLRLQQCDSWLQPAYAAQKKGTTARGRVEWQIRPDIDVGYAKLEGRGHDAENRGDLAVHDNRFPYNAGISGVAAVPQPFANESGPRMSRLVRIARKRLAQHRLHAKCFEKARGHSCTGNLVCLSIAGQSSPSNGKCGDILKRESKPNGPDRRKEAGATARR